MGPSGAFVEVGVVPSKRGATLLSCGREIARTLRDLQERHGPVDAVCLEGFMKGFAAGRFQTRGLFDLAQLNGIVAYEAANVFGVEPLVGMPNRVRTYFGVAEEVRRGRLEAAAAAAQPEGGALESPAPLPPGRPRAGGPALPASAIKSAVARFLRQRYPGVAALGSRGGDEADSLLVALFGAASALEATLVRDPALLAAFLQLATHPCPTGVPVGVGVGVGVAATGGAARSPVPLAAKGRGRGRKVPPVAPPEQLGSGCGGAGAGAGAGPLEVPLCVSGLADGCGPAPGGGGAGDGVWVAIARALLSARLPLAQDIDTIRGVGEALVAAAGGTDAAASGWASLDLDPATVTALGSVWARFARTVGSCVQAEFVGHPVLPVEQST